MPFAWIASELTTGNIIADLPDLQVDSVKSQIASYQTTTAVLPLSSAPENWLRATLYGATVYSAIDTDTNVPVWSGFITKRPRNLGNTLSLSLSTIEGYFDRRFVGDENYNSVGQNLIVQDLVNTYAAVGSNGGIPIRVQIVTAGNGAVRVRNYTDISDKTLYSALTELYGVDGGPEWTVTTEWQHNPERMTFVLQVGDRIGNAAMPGLAPNATFEAPSLAVQKAELTEDYSSANAGNDFMATSTASGDTRPQSAHVVVPDPDRPTFERRFTPSTSITSVPTLNDHAIAMAALQGAGSNTLALQAVVRDGVRLGSDWFIGDDLGYSIGGTGQDGKESALAFPGGYKGTARAVGWQLDFSEGQRDLITPIWATPEAD
ncbi:hypothetical protein [Humibacter sp. RRB41]|uniref:hypothetical protein n=1 Tax=Humibacter sp. RRB41 TaxID=2919946 RepID=UPI001FA9D14E|nr:hypothetical protein [Humibacter sp. RRB41]